MTRPITITYQDDGLIAITLDPQDFAMIQTGLKHLDPALVTDADLRFIKACEAFNAKLRAEIAAAAKHFPNN